MEDKGQKTELVVITGMSGAGKTVAVQSFEDLGYYCVDNLPPTLMPKFLELMKDSRNNIQNVAIVIDLRSSEFFDSLFDVLDNLGQEQWLNDHILFLDAEDQTLVTRFKETRRTHPLAPEGLLLNGIQREREMLDELRGRAQRIINTSELNPKELRKTIVSNYTEEAHDIFSVQIISFGYKYGVPIDADLLFDVRFLPNPHYVPQIKPMTGLDKEVASYVFKWSDTQKFNAKILDLLQFMLPEYRKEGKTQLVIGIGCTGGQHRSVAIAEYFKKQLSEEYMTYINHRDIDIGKDNQNG